MALYDVFSGQELEIAEKIQRRRLQILVHSYLYYDRDTNIVSDNQWAEWGRELVQLTSDYPKIAEQVPYHRDFVGFDASTGYSLPYREPNIVATACRLAKIPLPAWCHIENTPAPAPKKESKPTKTMSPLFSKNTVKPVVKNSQPSKIPAAGGKSVCFDHLQFFSLCDII